MKEKQVLTIEDFESVSTNEELLAIIKKGNFNNQGSGKVKLRRGTEKTTDRVSETSAMDCAK